MTMKVQGSSAAAVQTISNAQSSQSASTRTPESPASARVQPDDLSRLPRPDFDKHLGLKETGLPWTDRFTAADLHKTLSNPLNDHVLSAEKKSESISRDEKGIYRGPNGQPLVPVTLDDGKTAYVDPNTNRYYLTDEQPDAGGKVRTLPAIDLPKDAQFSNRYFNDQDAKDLTKIAEDHSIFPRPRPEPMPLPFPWPERPRPQPLPWLERPRLDVPDFGPIRDRNIAV